MARTESHTRGARELFLPDWPYGAVGRRLVLETVLLGAQPQEGWTKTALEKHAGTKPGGIDGVLAGALDWGLVVQDSDSRWHSVDTRPPIASPLEALLQLTRAVEDRPIKPLRKRAYQRKGLTI